MKFVRWFVGRLVLFINFITWPKAGIRLKKDQQKINEQLQFYSLYEFKACPFCVKVRREMQRLSLPIEVRDAKVKGPWRAQLHQQGGKIKVPCLRIDYKDQPSQWMYESNDIISFLRKEFPLKS